MKLRRVSLGMGRRSGGKNRDRDTVLGFANCGGPDLPPIWTELGKTAVRRWSIPAFFLALIASITFLLVKPSDEQLKSWPEYLVDARRAFELAGFPQDDPGRLLQAVNCLAGEDVNVLGLSARSGIEAESASEVAMRWPTELPNGADAAGPISDGVAPFRRDKLWGFSDLSGKERVPPLFDYAGRHVGGYAVVLLGGRWTLLDRQGKEHVFSGFHGVIPSYARVVQIAGRRVLSVEDVATIGESYYYLACVKEDRPSDVGRLIGLSAKDLFVRAIQYLDEAQLLAESKTASATSPSASTVVMTHNVTTSALGREVAVALRRRRMRTEAQVRLGRLADAGRDLEAAIVSLDTSVLCCNANEVAASYEVLGRVRALRDDPCGAVKWYRLALHTLPHGRQSQQYRFRLAEVLMSLAVRDLDVRSAMRRLMEVAALCRVVESSDAVISVRDGAAFLRGRALYRLGTLDSDRASASAWFGSAVKALRNKPAVDSENSEMSRLLLARALFMFGDISEGLEITKSMLAASVSPAILACAEVTRADMLVASSPLDALGWRSLASSVIRVDIDANLPGSTALDMLAIDLDQRTSELMMLGRGGALVVDVLKGGVAERAGIQSGHIILAAGSDIVCTAADLHRAVTRCRSSSMALHVVSRIQDVLSGHGYVEAMRMIKGLSPSDTRGLVPEMLEWLSDDYLWAAVPREASGIGRKPGRLLELARQMSDAQRYDVAICIYAHIMEMSASIAGDQYAELLGDLYAAKAEGLSADSKWERERAWSLRCSASSYMRAVTIADRGPARINTADACWRGCTVYYAARQYDEAVRALELFLRRFAGDMRSGEALYLLGDSLRNLGHGTKSVEVLRQCLAAHPAERCGYRAQLALGETYLEMGLLDREIASGGALIPGGALRVFDAMVRDVRYAPDSSLWMTALLRLGETHYLLGRRNLAEEVALTSGVVASRSQALMALRARAMFHLSSAVNLVGDVDRRCRQVARDDTSRGASVIDGRERSRSIRILGSAYLDLGQETNDEAMLREAEEVFRGPNWPAHQSESLAFIGLIRLMGNDSDGALAAVVGGDSDVALARETPMLSVLGRVAQCMTKERGARTGALADRKAPGSMSPAEPDWSRVLLDRSDWEKHLKWLDAVVVKERGEP